MSFPFNVRVYGALVHHHYLLLSSETYNGKRFTKLPGGGLEFGEGLREALVREFREEIEMPVKVLEHLYTTDFFVASAFNPEHQVISVYYSVKALNLMQAELLEDLELPQLASTQKEQSFQWVNLEHLSERHFTFPIDKNMVPILKKAFSGL